MSDPATGPLTAVPDSSAVTIDHPGGRLPLSVVPATDGQDGLDISGLLKRTGYITLDPGFVNTASCQSAITYIDGDAGVLRYRGYPIEQLAEGSSFAEVSYLLIYGELPTAAQLEAFTARINRHTILHEDLKRFFDGFPRDAHPMPVLSSAVSALSTFYQDSLNPRDAEQVELSTFRLLAKLPTIAAYAYRKSTGQPMLYPDNSQGLIENFLRMTFGFPSQPYEVDPAMVKALDLLLVLHADHEQNCSTSTVRMVGSSGANLFASVSAGIHALSGPAHGGANQAVLEMLEAIRRGDDDADSFMAKVKAKEKGVRLMGFGHRVYKNYDPRAAIVKRTADDVLERTGPNELLDIAKRLEEIALKDDYFVERKLYPNVDFYTGLIYQAMGFPPRMFTVLFALGRLPGWIAQWREGVEDPQMKINRPRQVYTGAAERAYRPLSQR
jgi:citrate synthase